MIRTKTIKSLEELISTIRNDYKSWNTTTFPWFRGEPNKPQTALKPKLYRREEHNSSDYENQLLQQFRIKAPSLGLMNTPLREHTDEWLYLAQHVGLPTRLLDWSEGLFVALYFAFLEKTPVIWMIDPVELNRRSISPNEHLDDNVYPLVWFRRDMVPATRLDVIRLANNIRDKYNPSEFSVNLGNINIRGAWEMDRFGVNLPVAIHPTNIHVRMHTQKSCFTVQGKNKECLSKLVDSRVLKKYVISKDSIDVIRKDLNIIGITHTSVFPDLDHLAKELSDLFY
jgi:hypothetical protein